MDEVETLYRMLRPRTSKRRLPVPATTATYILTEFAKGKPLNTLTTNNFQLVLGWLWQQYGQITVS